MPLIELVEAVGRTDLLNQHVEVIFTLNVPHPLSHISMQVASQRESILFPLRANCLAF